MKHYIYIATLLLLSTMANAQHKSFKISAKGDTINVVDKKGLKQGKWVIRTEALRGEDGFEDEGRFKDDLKEGIWRHYTLMGDPIGFETYLHGGKDGLQQYYTPFGELIREESWKGYNPDAPYDTIPIYGTGSNEILNYKIVKAVQYSVKQGTWRFYESFTGKLIRKEEWERNNLVIPNAPKKDVAVGDIKVKKVVPKTPEMLEFDKKKKGKKKALRDGETSL
jgi:antitoxin component YwqK of YwqJK toxin-antitoxin module